VAVCLFHTITLHSLYNAVEFGDINIQTSTQELTISYTGAENNIKIGTNDNTMKGLRTEATHENQSAT
jgi:hypothetical protein